MRVGERVMLKSGGPEMTVIDTYRFGADVPVGWFDGVSELHTAFICEEALVLVGSVAPPSAAYHVDDDVPF